MYRQRDEPDPSRRPSRTTPGIEPTMDWAPIRQRLAGGRALPISSLRSSRREGDSYPTTRRRLRHDLDTTSVPERTNPFFYNARRAAGGSASDRATSLRALIPAKTFRRSAFSSTFTSFECELARVFVPAGRTVELPRQDPHSPGTFHDSAACVLGGKRATTNKVFLPRYNGRLFLEAMTPKDIQWVPSACWAVDGSIWTTLALLRTVGRFRHGSRLRGHLGRVKIGRFIRGGIEIPEVRANDDPFSAFHGLV
ncbi:hypothetical protein DFH09DRAFT_1082229 [Mycena vulgaris]|nr:hypothetical protein DFH09DRAFT_1082229 [Mycena vulgaris]